MAGVGPPGHVACPGAIPEAILPAALGLSEQAAPRTRGVPGAPPGRALPMTADAFRQQVPVTPWPQPSRAVWLAGSRGGQRDGGLSLSHGASGRVPYGSPVPEARSVHESKCQVPTPRA